VATNTNGMAAWRCSHQWPISLNLLISAAYAGGMALSVMWQQWQWHNRRRQAASGIFLYYDMCM